MTPRARVRITVAAVALAAAGAAVAGALYQGRDAEPVPTHAQASQPPPLELGVALAETREARALRAAERLYDQGERVAARQRFEEILADDADSLEAAVGEAVAAWPDDTLPKLRALLADHPASGVTWLHLGFALFARGERDPATAAWRAVLRRDPDSPAALRAEDVLHPEMPPGRPVFVADVALPRGLTGLPASRQLRGLAESARAGSVEVGLLYGSFLQQVGRPVSALEAFERAAARAPDDPAALTAAALARFAKDDPARAFSRLGPLARDFPQAGVVRYHLGLALLWLGRLDESRRQLELARGGGGSVFYAREANRLLERLESIRTD